LNSKVLSSLRSKPGKLSKSTTREAIMINGLINMVKSKLMMFWPLYDSLLLLMAIYVAFKTHFKYIAGKIGIVIKRAITIYIKIINAY